MGEERMMHGAKQTAPAYDDGAAAVSTGDAIRAAAEPAAPLPGIEESKSGYLKLLQVRG